MKIQIKTALLTVCLPILLLLDAAPDRLGGVAIVGEAHAVFGMPLTPISVAGVARRTTRRAVVWSSSAAAASAAASTVSAQQAAPAPVPAPAAPGSAPPVGSIVSSLPAGCVSAPSGGVEYYQCGGIRYRPAFQGNNLVYVVQ